MLLFRIYSPNKTPCQAYFEQNSNLENVADKEQYRKHATTRQKTLKEQCNESKQSILSTSTKQYIKLFILLIKQYIDNVC